MIRRPLPFHDLQSIKDACGRFRDSVFPAAICSRVPERGPTLDHRAECPIRHRTDLPATRSSLPECRSAVLLHRALAI